MSKKSKTFSTLPFAVVDSDIDDILNEGKKCVQIGPKKYVVSELYKEYGLDIYNFEARQDDVYLMGFIRSGTTLHSEMVWLIGNDLNYEDAGKYFIDYRFPHIDFSTMGTLEWVKKSVEGDSVTEDKRNIAKLYEDLTLKGLAERKGRRFIKSHLPISLMPPHVFEVGAKVIYCARNPMDMLVSAYNSLFFFNRKIDEADYSFRQCFDQFKNDTFWACPYFEHVKEAWAKRNDENFLFLFYEDTVKDKRLTIKKVANFLGKKLSDDQLEALEDHLSFEKFKNNENVNCDQLVKVGVANNNQQFIRKGKTGSWRDYFVGSMEREVEECVKKNLAGSDYKFPKL